MKGFAYLLKLEADQNHNRYYRMVQEGDRFKIEMGRIGARPVCMIRPIYENHKEGTCVSFNSVLNYWIHFYIDHTNCSRPVYIMALIRRNYYVTKKLERCYINLR